LNAWEESTRLIVIPLRTMAPRSPAGVRPGARQVLDGIAELFYVKDSRLQEITKRLVEDFKLGLTGDGCPVGML
jgi:hypothetical protein